MRITRVTLKDIRTTLRLTVFGRRGLCVPRWGKSTGNAYDYNVYYGVPVTDGGAHAMEHVLPTSLVLRESTMMASGSATRHRHNGDC